MSGVWTAFLDHFGTLEDLRAPHKVVHSVAEMLLVTWCGVMAGADGWEDMEEYGASKIALWRELLPYTGGIPSGDTLRRFFRALHPERLREIFVAFVRPLLPRTADALRAIDGKTLRDSHDGASNARHLVRAFATEARWVRGQVATQEQSHEITAIPDVLRMLALRGATGSIDAMGCQRAMASQIVAGGGQYVLGLKGNQGTLHDEVRLYVETPPEGAVFLAHEESDTGHGRIATRRCAVPSAIGWLQATHRWPAFQRIVRVTATRRIGEKTRRETRFSLSSDTAPPARILANTRSHWASDNTLHSTLDRRFGADASRIRQDHAPLAIATIRHVALHLLQAAKQKRASMKRLRKKAGWDNNTLKRILRFS